MKNIFIVMLFFVFSLVLTSCGSNSDNGDITKDGQYSIDVSLVSDEDVEFNQNSMPTVVLYGYDESDADSAAIPIVTQRSAFHTALGLPYDTTIDLSENPAKYVCLNYDESNPCPVKYYLKAYIDVDGDGEICGGDFRQDYNKLPFESYTLEELTAKEHVISTKEKIDSDCEEVGGPDSRQVVEGLYELPVRMVSNENVELNQNSMPIIVLYGYDERLSESAAVRIVIQWSMIDAALELPYATTISLRDEPGPFVCKDDDDAYSCPARYYFTAYVDVDADGLICPGDLVQDDDMNSSASYTLEELTDSEHDIYMKVKPDDGSGCFSSSDPLQ